MSTPKKLTALLAVVVAAFAGAVSSASAQTVPVSEAQAFLGAWTMNIEGTPVELNILDVDGQVAAEMSAMGSTSRATSVSRAEESLTLSYVLDIDGQVAPIVVKLTPQGDNLAAGIDVAQGMYMANATAVRKAT